MKVFVDTSALIAILDADDLRHSEAAETFRGLVETAELVTHNYVQVEAVAVASRRLGIEAANTLTDSYFPLITTVWVDESMHAAAVAGQRFGSQKASLVDHVSFVVMRREGIEVAFAYDPDFQAQGMRPAVTAPHAQPPRQVHEAAAEYVSAAAQRQELVSVAEISARAGRSINTVQSWRRRRGDFPSPVARLAAGPIWEWSVVAAWILERRARTTPRGLGR